MKIMLFNKENKWIEVENGLDFDTFYTKVVLEERPFKFVDCINEEKEHFLLYVKNESAGLDDEEYYHFDASDDNSVDNIFIFDDLQLYTLDRVINKHKTILNYYKNFQKKIEENDKNDDSLIFRYSAGVNDKEKGIHETWTITLKAENTKRANEKLIAEIYKKWNEKYPNIPLPNDFLSYCRL